ncbi:hypothetical protein GCM10027047_32920 [Rhodococcus aerolatus]
MLRWVPPSLAFRPRPALPGPPHPRFAHLSRTPGPRTRVPPTSRAPRALAPAFRPRPALPGPRQLTLIAAGALSGVVRPSWGRWAHFPVWRNGAVTSGGTGVRLAPAGNPLGLGIRDGRAAGALSVVVRPSGGCWAHFSVHRAGP